MEIFNKNNSPKFQTFQNKIKLTWINQRPIIIKSTTLQKVKNGKIVNLLPSQNLKLPTNKPLTKTFFLTCQQTYEKIPLYTSTLSRLSYKMFVKNLFKYLQINNIRNSPGRFLPKFKLKTMVQKLKMLKRRRKKLPKQTTVFVGSLGVVSELKPKILTDINLKSRKPFRRFIRFVRFKVINFPWSFHQNMFHFKITKLASKIVKSKEGAFLQDFTKYYYMTGLNYRFGQFSNKLFGSQLNTLLILKSHYVQTIKTRLQTQWKKKKRQLNKNTK